MRAIVQKDQYGCGIACVAFVLNQSYANTLKSIKSGHSKVRTTGFYCKELVVILNKSLIKYEYKYLNNKLREKIYKDLAIVFIKRSRNYPSGHYLCRYNNLWMDPWINFRESKNLSEAKSGFRKRLPGKPVYAIIPKVVPDKILTNPNPNSPPRQSPTVGHNT